MRGLPGGNKCAKLTVWDVVAMRLLFDDDDPPTTERVARAFDVNWTTAYDVRTNRQWKWLIGGAS